MREGELPHTRHIEQRCGEKHHPRAAFICVAGCMGAVSITATVDAIADQLNDRSEGEEAAG